MIKQRRQEIGKTLEEVGKEMGVSKATVQRWESGEIKDMRRGKLVDLARALDTTPAYLMGWDEQPEFDPFTIPNIERPSFQRVPLLGDIACGEPILAEENVEEYVKVSASVKCDFILRCKGDSMSPRLLAGDIVLIRQQPDVTDGQIAAVLIDGEATLKHVYHLPHRGGLQLVSDNPAYTPMLYTNENCDSIRILGRAVAYQRLLP